jgi:ABC-type lipoprotein export system ATPase subunit
MIQCENLVKIYKTKDSEVLALQGLDLSVQKGEMMAIVGQSGSGKTTLLNIIGCLDKPSAGVIRVNGDDLGKLSGKSIEEYHRNTLGFVWQNSARNLLPYRTACENVEIPLITNGIRGRKRRALELLGLVGLSHRSHNKLAQLSGGEQQRVAIAISIANNPPLLLADEPTGNLDTTTMGTILDVFRDLNKTLNLTIVIVTHDRDLTKRVDRIVVIRDGRTSSEFIRKKAYSAELAKMGDDAFTDPDDRTHDELVVVDKTGRLQIPEEFRDTLGLAHSGMVRVEKKGTSIVLSKAEKKKRRTKK